MNTFNGHSTEGGAGSATVPEDLEIERDERDEDEVKVSRKALNEVLTRLETLEKAQAETNPLIAGITKDQWEENKERTPTARLKKYRETTEDEYSLVIGWDKISEDPDKQPPTHLYKVKFRKPNGEIWEKKMELTDLVAIKEAEVVKVVDRKVKKMRMSQGFTTLKEVAYDKYQTIDTGQKIPLIVTKDVVINTIELPNGDRFDMPEEFKNNV